MPGSFCILFFCNTIYVNYGSLMIYNTNHTISSKIIVKKEGDTSNPPFQICLSPFIALHSTKEMVTLSYWNRTNVRILVANSPNLHYNIKKRTDVCTKGEVHMTNEDYKKLIDELLKPIEDNKLLEALFYVIQKLVGRGF